MRITPRAIWDVYREAVGGKTYDGKPMPEFEDCAPSALKGWEAVAEFASRWDRLDWGDTNERIGRFFIPTHSIRDEPAMVAAILSRTIVVRAEHHFASSMMEYCAYSPVFDICAPGDAIPEYNAVTEYDVDADRYSVMFKGGASGR